MLWAVWGELRETGPQLLRSEASQASPGESALGGRAFGRPKLSGLPRRRWQDSWEVVASSGIVDVSCLLPLALQPAAG